MTSNSNNPSAVPPPPQNGRVRLDSWKTIAAHLNRDVRTVERWAKARGMPVYRAAGAGGHSVFAFTDELDAWLLGPAQRANEAAEERSGAEGPRARSKTQRRLAAAAAVALAACVMLIAVALMVSGRTSGAVQDVRASGNTLSAVGQRGETLWSKTYAGPIVPAILWDAAPGVDGHPSTVVGVDLYRGGQYYGQLDSLSPDGSVTWHFSPSDVLRFVGGQYTAPWGNTHLLTYLAGGHRRVAWAAHHHTWWPSILFILDDRGIPVERFVNAGWITEIGITADNRFLLVAGVNQEFDAAMLAVLDVNHVSGSSPADGNSAFSCVNCPVGRPVKYFVLPYPELRRLGDRDVIRPVVHAFPSGAVELRLPPGPVVLPGAEVIYEFSSALDLVQASASERYWEWHRTLEASGAIAHPASECPERQGFEAREWSPQSGWKTLKVTARRASIRP